MPYGLPKEMDTPENNKRMERCVQQVCKEGKGKVAAIKICKMSLMKSAMLRGEVKSK